MSLTGKKKAFIAEYVKCRNACLAAKNAGYSKKTAYSSGPRLLQDPEIKKEIEKYEKKALKNVSYSVEKALSELDTALSQALAMLKPSAAVSAIMAKAKLAGLLENDRDDEDDDTPFEVIIRK